ncbi:Imm52 family immunity protein [Streptomyces sp. HMX112]|uniref:Imm52 family immunity protein n=1 Tax=Streptomyces sp. HMX112 TaxID=3390850 RepID=UPI003A7FBBAE
MRRVVRGFWGPRRESERELAVRWSALLARLRDIDGNVFGTWRGVPGTGTDTGRDTPVRIEPDALAGYLLKDGAGDDWSDQKGLALALSTPAGCPARVGVNGTGGGASDHLPMSVVLTITVPDGGPALPYADILRAVAETWDVDWGEATGTELQLALEDDGRVPGQPCAGWAGYLSARRAALLAAADLPLPMTAHPTDHGGVLLDLSAAGVQEVVEVNRHLRATGALEPLPRPMDRPKL